MIPHNRLTLGPLEQEAAQKVLASGWLAQGKEVQAFEDEVCAFLGLDSGHAVALSSGTAALFVALKCLLPAGSSIALPAYVCSSLRNAVAMAGQREVLHDSQTTSPNLDLNQAQSADGAIIAHMYGIPTDLGNQDHPMLIEDCAQAIGASVRGKKAGTFGRAGVFSFYSTKLITSGGQGGMVVSADADLINQIRDYREFDCREDATPRFNFQMTDLQAAIGRVQLRRFPQFIQRREEIFQAYQAAGLNLLEPTSPDISPVRFRAILQHPDPERIIAGLETQQIRAINPLESWELLGKPADFPKAASYSQGFVSLPIYPSLTDDEQTQIIQRLQTLVS